jgi:hypothetical protein
MLAGGNLPFGLLEKQVQGKTVSMAKKPDTRKPQVYLRIHEYNNFFFRYPISHLQTLHQERYIISSVSYR